MPIPSDVYVTLLEKAVAWLSSAIVVLGGSFSTALIYIYKQGQGTVSSSLKSMDRQIGEVAESLTRIADKLFDKTDGLADRISAQEVRVERVEAICRERHAAQPSPRPATSANNPWIKGEGKGEKEQWLK